MATKTLFVDAASLAYRAYHAVPEIRADDGTLVNAAYGFLNLMSRLVPDRDPNVRVLYTLRGVTELAHVDEAWIHAKYGIPGDRYFDYAVLRGDPSDGLPGVRGIGEKTASDLVRKYGSLDAILAASDLSPTIRAKLRASADYLVAARKVVLMPRDAPVTSGEGTLPRTPTHPERVLALAKRYPLAGAAHRRTPDVAGRVRSWGDLRHDEVAATGSRDELLDIVTVVAQREHRSARFGEHRLHRRGLPGEARHGHDEERTPRGDRRAEHVRDLRRERAIRDEVVESERHGA